MYPLNECIKRINTRLTEEGLDASMNARLLRHYQSKGVVSSPERKGRIAYYNDTQVETVVDLRKAQTVGITSKGYYVSKQLDSRINERLRTNQSLESCLHAFSGTTSKDVKPQPNTSTHMLSLEPTTPKGKKALAALNTLRNPKNSAIATLPKKIVPDTNTAHVLWETKENKVQVRILKSLWDQQSLQQQNIFEEWIRQCPPLNIITTHIV